MNTVISDPSVLASFQQRELELISRAEEVAANVESAIVNWRLGAQEGEVRQSFEQGVWGFVPVVLEVQALESTTDENGRPVISKDRIFQPFRAMLARLRAEGNVADLGGVGAAFEVLGLRDQGAEEDNDRNPSKRRRVGED